MLLAAGIVIGALRFNWHQDGRSVRMPGKHCVWYGMVYLCMLFYGMVLYGTVCHDMVWYGRMPEEH